MLQNLLDGPLSHGSPYRAETLPFGVELDILVSQVDPRHAGLAIRQIQDFVCGVDPDYPDTPVTVFTGGWFVQSIRALKLFRPLKPDDYHPSSDLAAVGFLIQNFKLSIVSDAGLFQAQCPTGFVAQGDTLALAVSRCLAQRVPQTAALDRFLKKEPPRNPSVGDE